MAFTQTGLERTFNHKRGGFDTFVYRTTDTIATVLVDGYFNRKEFGYVSLGPAPHLVHVYASEGYYAVEYDFESETSSIVNYPSKNGELVVTTSTGLLMRRLAINATDLNVLIISDSTGNGTNEWVYLLSNWYATEYPAYSVEYKLWDDGVGDYAAAVSISTGTGANTLTVYNFANSGKNIDFGLGSKFNNSVALLPNCDLIIINHGHNMYAVSDDDYTDRVRVPRFISGVGQTVQAHPDAGLIMIAQNPRRDDDQQQRITEALNKAASLLNADIANVYDLFINQNKSPSLYIDNVHPSDAGTALYLQSVIALHNVNSIPKPAVSSYDLQLKNTLINGDFSAFGGATPDNWTSSGTITKEGTTFFGGNGYSVGVEDANSFLQYAFPVINKPAIIGKWVTLSVLMYIESGAGVRSGRIGIATPLDPSTNSTELAPGVSTGGWKWVSVSAKIRDTSGYILVKILGDAGGAVFVDRAILVQGKLPTNAAS